MLNEVDWNQTVADLGPRLYRYFCVRFSDEQADDLTQETLIRLVRKVRSGAWRAEQGNLRMFAFGIAHYVALESLPTRILGSLDEVGEDLASDSTNLEDWVISQDQARKVKEHMNSLSPVEQQVLALLVDEEMILAEIAVILGCPEGTVKSHVHRAKKKLMEKFRS